MKLNVDSSQHDRVAEFKRSSYDSAFMRAHGLEVEEIAAGEVIFHLPKVQESQRGGGGTVEVLNGGVIAYMFDGALGWSVISSLLAMPEARDINPFDLRQFTISLDITYLEAAFGNRFEAHGKVVRASRSMAFAEGRFLDEKGKVCATAKGIWRVFWPRSGATTRL